ncbi:TonB-dependent receptor plug domain-containing protein [Hymenobacter caeli]|uniref:TonB-dependent SusC/RagA subfamily outer membrane receptor n=1 Tax=Hymenobacter caeli TaxID=2735894 RepID=A0ABX2FM72_9BACT|nr:TonB-dependent receptor plug domain-containing protein [Hymenobacter caeli]NRT18248.1 TonB-dependent SusC/RagA subfamily outer membrane receptor [Hymenobacter caeli]
MPPLQTVTTTQRVNNLDESPVITKLEIKIPPFTTIQPALSRVAGVQYTPNSGAPGAWAAVRIRGSSNVTGNSQPLYVVDGVPVYNTEITPEDWSGAEAFFRNQYPSSTNGSFYAGTTPHTPAANPLLDVPVEDVAQVEILKGAAATARYGMQGANGVVLISTRRGADGQAGPQPLRVRYAGWGGVQQVRQRYEVLGARPYAELANVAAANNGQPPAYSAAALNNLGEVDQQDQVLRVAGVQNHHLSVDGLHGNTRYYASADYLRQAGVVDGSDLSRYHLRLNLDQQLTPKLSLGLKASVGQTDAHYAGTEPDAGPLLQGALLAPPLAQSGRTGGSPYYSDPLREFKFFARAPRTRRLLMQLSATYQFSDALSLSVRGGYEQANARELGYAPDDIMAPAPNLVESSTFTTTAHNWVADAVLRYRRTFADRHALTASLTYLLQQRQRQLENSQYSGSGPSASRSYYQETLRGNGVHSPTVGVGYTYDGRYEVQGSLRTEAVYNEAYSRSQYQWFPGAQLSWHANKEAFLAAATGLSDLTLWAGVGKTGTYFAPDLTTHYDAGLRLGVLGGRLTLDAEAYQRRTRHAQTLLVFSTFFQSGSGQNFYYLFPDVTLLNQGLELTLSGTWQLGPLAGTTSLAAATNHNQVETVNSFATNASFFGLEAGQPLARFFVYEPDGTYPAGSPNAGQLRYRDVNNDGQVDARDGRYQGSGLPRYTLDFYQQLHLRRFQLDAQLDGLFGYQLLNPTLGTLDTPTGFTNSSPRALDYWTPSHQDTSVPRPGVRQSYLTSSQALESGNHVRLTQLTLAYEVLTTGPRRASVWVGGQNLFVTGHYRGFDPNVSSGGSAQLFAGQDASVYPVARVWQVGVRGSF